MQPKENIPRYAWHTDRKDSREPSSCRILVLGVGGAGSNTVTRLMEAGITFAECIAINTDAVHLRSSKANQKVLIGEKLVKGLGVRGDPRLGKAAVEESR